MMINTGSNISFTWRRIHIYLVFSLAFILSFQSCQLNHTNSYKTVICNVDTTQLDKEGKKFVIPVGTLSSQEISVSGYLNTLEAHTGTHSVLLTGKKKFGLSTNFKELHGNEHFIISVWRKDASRKSALIVQGDKTNSLYIAQKEAIEQGQNGWERLEVEVEVPPNIKEVKFYVWKIGADSAFFDDLEIRLLPEKEYPAYAEEPKLHLYFGKKNMKKFEAKRFRAFEDGILISDGEWMKGVMSDEKGVMPIKARLKGDWLDHLHGKKWSMRVKIRDDYTFNRMRVFSLQNPMTRYYLNEYMAHQFYTQEGVLTTRYGFIPLYFNGKSLGIYAWEEHFTKQLIEYNLRREGPIMKFDEDPFWRMQQHYKTTKTWIQLPFYETSRVIAFGLGKILSKPVLAQQFHIAQGLMYQYKNQKAPIEELFNLDIFAKYWAIGDIINGRHGRAWHNQRMYYNPVLCKLEPINFDDYTDEYPRTPPADILALSVDESGVIPVENNLSNHIFSSPQFLELYLMYLEKYSNEDLIRTFIEGERESFSHTEKLIQEEFSRYKFDEEFLLKNAARIREKLPEFKQKLADKYYDHLHVTTAVKSADTGYFPVLIPNYVNSYYHSIETGGAQILLENFSGRIIEVLGLADEDKRMITLLNDHVFLQPFVKAVRDTSFVMSYNDDAAYLAFRANEHDEILYSELSLWEKNIGLSPFQKLLHSSDYTSVGLFEEIGDSLIVKSGKYQLSEKVLIPANKILVFEANIELDIVKEATIISYSPVFMNGEEDKPIHIYSSDSTANAFTVLQAKGKSKLDYVVFSHLNTMSYEGWNLTGAVNFYESDVEISNCVFENNHCEDALNIVRSNFLVTQSEFLNIFSDAFDSDFCTGTLENSTFQYVGNDAIDFSTSQITIDQCDIKNISDKGISGGEGSTLSVLNTTILDCNIGAASKDLSVVDLQNVNIENCNYGLLALQKKPEYGPAILKGKKLKLINCTKKYLIEKQSVLHINGRKVEGTQKKVAELFY